MLAYYVHNISPFVFPSLSNRLPLHWYGLAYVMGFYCGYLVMVRLTKQGLGSMKAAQIGDFITYAALFVPIGTVVDDPRTIQSRFAPEVLVRLDVRHVEADGRTLRDPLAQEGRGRLVLQGRGPDGQGEAEHERRHGPTPSSVSRA